MKNRYLGKVKKFLGSLENRASEFNIEHKMLEVMQ